MEAEVKTKFCKHCGEKIEEDGIICPKCGKPIEELYQTTAISGIVTSVTAQIRSDGAIRFIYKIGGIDMDSKTGIQGAMIKIGDVKHRVITMGMIFARKNKLGDKELVVGMSGVSYVIEAKKLLDPAKVSDYITVDGDEVLFTGVITGIPEKAYAETLVVRAFVLYDDNGVATYIYGNAAECAYNDITVDAPDDWEQ